MSKMFYCLVRDIKNDISLIFTAVMIDLVAFIFAFVSILDWISDKIWKGKHIL